MNEQHDSILITLSLHTIKKRSGGLRQIINEWLASDGERQFWYYKVGNAPKSPERILNVFWIINKRVRWKCKLFHVERDRPEITFTDGRTMAAKSWLVLFDFEPIPRSMQLDIRGFQGFRYFDSSQITELR